MKTSGSSVADAISAGVSPVAMAATLRAIFRPERKLSIKVVNPWVTTMKVVISDREEDVLTIGRGLPNAVLGLLDLHLRLQRECWKGYTL